MPCSLLGGGALVLEILGQVEKYNGDETMIDKSPKTIATINFKGGVGKTTVTWCLGDVLSSMSNQNVLMFDLDAQMSLTQAIALNEDTGYLVDKFGIWCEIAIKRKKTVFDALDAFTLPAKHFDFGVGLDFIYQITKQFHFVSFSRRLVLARARSFRPRWG